MGPSHSQAAKITININTQKLFATFFRYFPTFPAFPTFPTLWCSVVSNAKAIEEATFEKFLGVPFKISSLEIPRTSA